MSEHTTGHTTERLLEDLARGLTPVRRIPSIRTALFGVAIAFCQHRKKQ